MKRWAILFFFLVALCGVGGCKRAGTESAFLAGFSIGPIIEANEQYLIARHTLSGGTVSEPPVPFFQMHEEAIVEIEPARIPAFVEALRSDIERSLAGSGAKIVGRGGDHPALIEQARASQGAEISGHTSDRQGQEGGTTDIAGFSFRYSDGQAEGAINVWGVRGEGTRLVLIVLVTES